MNQIEEDKVKELRELVYELDVWLEKNRPEFYTELRPGATKDDLARFQKKLKLNLPESFNVLYRWRDGQKTKCLDSFQCEKMFMSLQSILESKQELDSMVGTEFKSGWWNKRWVPFLDDGAGSYLCIDLTTKGNGRILEFFHDQDSRKPRYISLTDWLEELVRSMKDGSYETE